MTVFCGDKKDVTIDKELLPCPFCGAVTLKTTYEDYPIVWASRDTMARHFKIECPECGCHMSDYGDLNGTPTRLINTWNGLSRLDRCPICNDYVRQCYSSSKDGGYYIRCDKCCLTSPVFAAAFEAHDYWNRRIPR